MVNKDDDT